MSDARTEILARVDRALKTARIPTSARVDDERASARQAPSEGARGLQPSGTEGGRKEVALQERFVAEARALGVDAFVETSDDAVRTRLASLVNGLRVLSWNAEQLPYGAGGVVARAATGASPRDEQARAQVGVTGCHGAIAETGSLALVSLPGCSRAVPGSYTTRTNCTATRNPTRPGSIAGLCGGSSVTWRRVPTPS